jgi:flagellar biosynthesis protein FliQ
MSDRAFKTLFVCAVIVVIAIWAAVLVTTAYALSEIREQGLKSVVEDIWEGQ